MNSTVPNFDVVHTARSPVHCVNTDNDDPETCREYVMAALENVCRKLVLVPVR